MSQPHPRAVPPANEAPEGRVAHPPGEVVAADIAELLADSDATLAAVDGPGLVGILPNPGDELPGRLVDAHPGWENVVTVSGAPPDVTLGQVGALAGIGGAWVATRPALAEALAAGPRSEAELRWLLWNEGSVVVPVSTVGEDAERGWDAVTADRIPLAEVRPADLLEATVPTISFVLHGPGASPEVLAPWPTSSRAPSEVLLVGVDGLPSDGRLRGVRDIDDAVASARGALVWFVRADADVHREAYARALRRLEDPRVELVQVAYTSPGGTARSARGLVQTDLALGAPVFAIARRRVLRKARGSFDAVWPAAVARERGMIVASHPVHIDAEVPTRPLPPIPTLVDMARATAGRLRRSATGSTTTEPSAPERRTVAWVGFSGHGNFGDELVLRAARELLPELELVPGGEGDTGVVLGGGTLLNADRYYQRIAHDVDAPGLHRLVLGTGVVSPEVRGWTEPLEGWRAFLDAGPVGLRGPHSVEHLRAWGHAGPAEVLGDPALAVSVEVDPRPGAVVLAPIGRSSVGQVEDDEERQQVDLLTALAEALAAEGREVVLLTAHAGDDRLALQLVRALGDRITDVVHAHRDLDAGLRTLAAAEVVVGARLHALVAAAAAGTPFVGLAYRPKLADFAASIGVENAVRPIAAWSRSDLLAAVRGAPAAAERAGAVQAVDALRRRLEARCAEFQEVIAASR